MNSVKLYLCIFSLVFMNQYFFSNFGLCIYFLIIMVMSIQSIYGNLLSGNRRSDNSASTWMEQCNDLVSYQNSKCFSPEFLSTNMFKYLLSRNIQTSLTRQRNQQCQVCRQLFIHKTVNCTGDISLVFLTMIVQYLD